MVLLRMEGGRIAELWGTSDRMGMLTKLGDTPGHRVEGIPPRRAAPKSPTALCNDIGPSSLCVA